MELTDADLSGLLAAVARRDGEALGRLMAACMGRVYGLALRITRDAALAEDIAQDVFVQVWHGAATFDRWRGAPMAWLVTICRSRALDALRRDRTLRRAHDGAEAEAVAAAPAAPDLQDLLAATRQHRALHAALAGLDPAQRQLIGLAYFQDLSHARLAEQLGLPLGTVKSRLRAALAALRDELPDAS